MNRRDFIFRCSCFSISVFFNIGCNIVKSNENNQRIQFKSKLIDVHCHIFNGSDLPTVRFIKIVVGHHYPKLAIKTLDIEDSDVIDWLLKIFTFIVGRTKAPTAIEEIKVLDQKAKIQLQNSLSTENEAAVINAIGVPLAEGPSAVSDSLSATSFNKLRSAIFQSAGETSLGVSDLEIGQQEASAIASKSYRSKTDLGLLFRWFGLFTRYRFVLADQLANDHKRQGFDPILLCPAVIDYDLWLGENVEGSPLPDQVSVMGQLSRRKTGAVVHGYVGFDPLRQAAFESGFFNLYSPLELVRRAIRDEGFLGVKLYPPMGFKPLGNAADVCQPYTQEFEIFRKLMGEIENDPLTINCEPSPVDGSRILGEKLDKSMIGLFNLCVSEEASIIAHAGDSNSSNEGWGKRADPAHWIPVFRRWPKLRVTLAHFGSFNARSASAAPEQKFPDASWEWTFGNYLIEADNPPVFADISYLTEISNKTSAEKLSYIETIKIWISKFDPQCNHLIFGTDWTMLGLDPAYEGYTSRIYSFFKDECGFNQAMLDRLFYENAIRFLGLRQNDGARKRLLEFYNKNNIPVSRFPL